MAWWIWLIIAVVLLIVEIMTLDLVLLMLSGGAIAAAIAAGAFGADDVLVQVLVWAAVSVLLLVFVRKWALSRLHLRDDTGETNAAAYAGQPGIAVTAVDGVSGRIKFNGEVWTARTDSEETIGEGAAVVVVKIDGATAVVKSQ